MVDFANSVPQLRHLTIHVREDAERIPARSWQNCSGGRMPEHDSDVDREDGGES